MKGNNWRYSGGIMTSVKQEQQKNDKRAAALRDNLRKRKTVQKTREKAQKSEKQDQK
jgi:hypothetical protein